MSRIVLSLTHEQLGAEFANTDAGTIHDFYGTLQILARDDQDVLVEIVEFGIYEPAPCTDCGVDTLNIPGHEFRRSEYYMLDSDVWEAVADEHDRYLCIGCLEQRMGRQLTPDDFQDVPINQPDHGKTERLISRLGHA